MNRTQQAWLSDSTGLWGINKTQAKTGISRKELQRDLPSVEAYQRTKEQRHREKQFNKIVAEPRYMGRDDCFQGDLMDIEPTKRGRTLNKGIRFLCVFIDVYSRKIWVQGIKKKTTAGIMEFAEPLLRKLRPRNLTYDRESGVRSNKMKALLKELDIRLWHPTRDQPEAKRIPGATAIVERLNRTLRKLIVRWKVAFKDKAWAGALHRLVENYNSTPHSAFKHLPKGVRTPNLVYQNQNAHLSEPRPRKPVKEFSAGDQVRVRQERSVFQKRSTPEWGKDVHTVEKRGKYTYNVANSRGVAREQPLTARDLQAVPPSTFSVRRSRRGRAVDNLPDGDGTFLSLSPLRKPFTKQIKQMVGPRRSERLSEKKTVRYGNFY
jgi:hypothetical protein